MHYSPGFSVQTVPNLLFLFFNVNFEVILYDSQNNLFGILSVSHYIVITQGKLTPT